MKSKQLANVLIKMLGLSVCLYAIPSCISGMLRGIVQMHNSPQWLVIVPVVSYGIGAAIQAGVGLVIIAKSQRVAGWMFKSDED
jgi:hypothetical protein